MADHEKQTGGASGAEAFADSLRGSARQIWLAGLGALARAQQEGGKLFETLVREGASLQREFKPDAQERMARARERMADVSAKASDRIERMFDERVAKALERLDVPLAGELDALRTRVDELERVLVSLAAKPVTRRRPRREDEKPTASGNSQEQ